MNQVGQKVTQQCVRAGSMGLLSVACMLGMSLIGPSAYARTSMEKAKAASASFALPVANGRISSRFHQGRWHPAIDLAAPRGTPVAATTSSQTISFAGQRGGYGNVVIARDGQGRTHLYAHLHSITARVGQVLKRGQRVGTVGSTGFSTGPHLHYELRAAGGNHIDPAPFLFPKNRMAALTQKARQTER